MVDLRRIQELPPIQQGIQEGKKSQPPQNGEFAQVLDEAKRQQGQLRFSAHALDRMTQRGIELTPNEMKRFENAVQTAADKGSRSSLVLLDEKAFVVSVANRTVITALDSEGLKDQVVTDIDSAVIM